MTDIFFEVSSLPLLILIVFILIFVNFLWQLLLDFSDYALAKKYQHIQSMLVKVFKEITLLGIWSILLLITRLVIGSKSWKYIFELIHFTLFLLIVFYIFTVFFVALISLVLFKYWEHLELSNPDLVNWEYHHKLLEFHSISPFLRYIRVSLVARILHLRSSVNYHIIRTRFIQQNNLNLHFNFHRYLRRCQRIMFKELAHIHWSVIAIVLVFEISIWRIILLIFEYKGVSLTCISTIMMVLELLLYIKSRYIFNFYLQNENILQSSMELDVVNIEVYNRQQCPRVDDQSQQRQFQRSDLKWIIGCLIPSIKGNFDWLYKIKSRCGIDLPQSLFWFRSPAFFLYLLQILIFYKSTVFAIIVTIVLQQTDVVYYWVFYPCIICLVGFSILIPSIIYNFSIVSNIGEFSRFVQFEEVSRRHKKRPLRTLSSFPNNHNFNHALG